MKLGTISYDEKIHNLEYMNLDEIEDFLKKIIDERKQSFNSGKKLIEEKKDVALLFKKFINDANEKIIVEAAVERAFTDKTTTETVNHKVNSQVNVLNFGIRRINSKFTEKSKNYDIVKEQILDSITKYESVLNQMAEFYDSKIEQLIVRKLELQTNLVGKIARQKYLINKQKLNNKVKENATIKNLLKTGLKKAIEKIKIKRQKEEIEPKDKKSYEKEQIIKKANTAEQLDKKIKENKEQIDKINKEIYLTTSEIKILNDRKKQALYNAMETEDKWLVTKIKRPKTFERITRFFSSRINTPKVIKKTLIDPFNEKIQIFIDEELSSIK